MEPHERDHDQRQASQQDQARRPALAAVDDVDHAAQLRTICGRLHGEDQELDFAGHAGGSCIARARGAARRHDHRMGETRDERRRREREAQRRREQELEEIQDQPRLPSFEPPPAGKIVETPRRPQPKKD